MVYLAKKGNEVIHHTDKQAMLEMDGIAESDMEISDEKFMQADCLARIIDGKIVIGKTDNEKTIEANNERVSKIDKELNEIDALSTRSSRAVAYAFAVGEAPAKEDVAKVKEYEQRASTLRKERAALKSENEKLA